MSDDHIMDDDDLAAFIAKGVAAGDRLKRRVDPVIYQLRREIEHYGDEAAALAKVQEQVRQYDSDELTRLTEGDVVAGECGPEDCGNSPRGPDHKRERTANMADVIYRSWAATFTPAPEGFRVLWYGDGSVEEKTIIAFRVLAPDDAEAKAEFDVPVSCMPITINGELCERELRSHRTAFLDPSGWVFTFDENPESSWPNRIAWLEWVKQKIEDGEE